MYRFARRIVEGTIIAGAALLLAACSSLNAPTAAKLQAIDYANDDVPSLLIAFDVPLTLEPVPGGSSMIFTLGSKKFTAVLVRADLDDVAGTLPPPAADRTYYLFAFSEADKTRIRNLQADAKVTPGGTSALTVGLSPLFCRTEEIDPAKTRFSVLLSLPGGGGKLDPLFSNASLADALAASPEKTLPLCEGHSG